MSEQRIHHDAAWAAADAALALLGGRVADAERAAVHEQLYRIAHAALEAAAIFRSREERRLNPSRN